MFTIFMRVNIKDIVRPISGFVFIQPFVIIWLFLTSDNPMVDYIRTGWLFQIYLTLLFIPYYSWFERAWTNKFDIIN